MNDAAFTPSLSAAQGFRNSGRLPALFWAAHSCAPFTAISSFAMLSVNDSHGPHRASSLLQSTPVPFSASSVRAILVLVIVGPSSRCLLAKQRLPKATVAALYPTRSTPRIYDYLGHDPKPQTLPHNAAHNTATAQQWRFSSMSSRLDGRDPKDGEINFKPGDTAVGTLRRVYGDDFALGYPSDTRLRTVLNDAGVNTLVQYFKNRD